jgi:murein DD-endopeptidase MepM/ murein hydrolase activator NlpD
LQTPPPRFRHFVRGALALAAALSLGSPLAPAAPIIAAEVCDPMLPACSGIHQAQDQAAVNREKLNEIQAHISDQREKMNALSDLIHKLDSDIAVQQREIATTQGRIDDLERQMRQIQADIDSRSAHIQIRETLLDQRVRSMDKHGRINYMQLLVTSRSFTELVDRVVTVEAVVASDRRLIAQLQHDKQDLQAVRVQLNSKRDEQRALLGEQKKQVAVLEAHRQVQQSAYAEQARIEAQFESQRRELEAQQAQIQASIRQLQAQYERQLAALAPPAPPVAPPSGGGPVPVPVPAPQATSGFIWPEGAHVITQGFGCTTFLAEPYNPNCPTRHWHTGVDIAGPNGTPIFASAAGIVQAYPGGGGYGNYIVLLHNGGYSSLYGHMSGFAVGSGQVVRQGQVIGYEGSTGFSTGPHLHFEIRVNGNYQDPCAYVSC